MSSNAAATTPTRTRVVTRAVTTAEIDAQIDAAVAEFGLTVDEFVAKVSDCGCCVDVPHEQWDAAKDVWSLLRWRMRQRVEAD